MNRLDRIEVRSRAFRKGLYVIREGDNSTWPKPPGRRPPKYVLVTQDKPDHALAVGPLELMDRCVRAWRTDTDLLAAWTAAGGDFTGTLDEIATMPEAKLLVFLRKQGF